MKQSLNDQWQFTPTWSEDFMLGRGLGEPVRLPHTNAELENHYCTEKSYEMVAGYRTQVLIPQEWSKKRIFLHFEGVAHVATVYCNGEALYTHKCGYTAFSVEVTHAIKFGEENLFAVQADSRESCPVPPFGFVIDYMTYGGMYREAWLEVEEASYLADLFVSTDLGEITVNAVIAGKDQLPKGATLTCSVVDGDGPPLTRLSLPVAGLAKSTLPIPNCLGVSPYECIGVSAKLSAAGLERWELEAPKLYSLICTLSEDDRILSSTTQRFGLRTAEFRGEGFYLNGSPVKLRGLNRHQSYPRIGYAAPASLQWLDAGILKNELGCNAVRTSHYPQSRHFINRCDELGLLVFTEIPGWQYIGDESWQAEALYNVEEMVVQYRNHPSIVLWGVRINESQDNEALYLRTNVMARNLDPTRQTGGVRYLEKSQLLEDVYTYNDFSQTTDAGGLKNKHQVLSLKDKNAPYLVSEYNGHMFPTKPFDSEDHRVSHALRHAGVLSAMYSDKGVSGSFGWCMFDYNTHREFGSGDRMCYHGVMDQYRNPKLAAAVYLSQQDNRPVLTISSSMDIGEHPGGRLPEVYAFTNGDEVRLYKNDLFVRSFYPNRRRFPGLPHPPVVIDDFVGELLETEDGLSAPAAADVKVLLRGIAEYGINDLPPKFLLKMAKLLTLHHLTVEDGYSLYSKYAGGWGSGSSGYRFEALREGKVFATVVKAPVEALHLKVTPSSTVLREGDTYDMALVRISAVDQNENPLPYYQEAAELTSAGDIQLVGPRIIPLPGGGSGCYIRTIGKAGRGTLTVTAPHCPPVTLSFTVTKGDEPQ